MHNKRKIVQRLLKMLEMVGLSALATLVIAAVVALRHLVETPQPLESILPGTPHIYRWRQGHIFYQTLGDQHTPPLVLLHASTIGSSTYEMRKVVGALAQKYHVYVPDLLGFGLSDRPKIDYSAETYIDLCRDFLSEVVNLAPARDTASGSARISTTLLASGLSCNYAVIAAKRYPEICSRLVLISPWELFGEKQAQARSIRTELLQAPIAAFLLYPIISTRLAHRYMLARQHASHHAQISASDIDYLYATSHQFGAEHAPLARLAGKLAIDASEAFDTLQQPVLVIWGAGALNNAWSIASKHHMPERSEIVLIQDAGLYVHEEYPAIVVANILQWGEEGKSAEATPHEADAGADKVQPGEEEQLLAYCIKCKKKTTMLHAQPVTMKNGSPALKGTCSVCGSGQFRIGKSRT